jgi:hypothetical protein
VHWLSALWFNYFWPSLKGNGPEALIQTVVYGVAAWLFIPPVREWMNNHMKELHKKLDEAHAKLDHVITHSTDIPPFDSDTVVKPKLVAKKVGIGLGPNKRDANGRFTK